MFSKAAIEDILRLFTTGFTTGFILGLTMEHETRDMKTKTNNINKPNEKAKIGRRARALSVDSMLGLGCLKGKQWKR